MDKPVLSYKSAENWDIHELDEKRLFGTKLHFILAEIKKQSDLEIVLERAVTKGKINADEQPLQMARYLRLYPNLIAIVPYLIG